MFPPVLRREAPLPTTSAHLPEDQVNDFVDGLLSATDRASVSEHLVACERCRAEIAELSELVGIARADATLVVAPRELELVVLATTIQERAVRRYVLHALRLRLAMCLLIVVMSSVTLTVWILTACTKTERIATAGRCSGPWYFAVRDGARERYKEVRDDQRLLAQKFVKNFRP